MLVYIQKKYRHIACCGVIYDVRLSLTLNSELLCYKNYTIDSKKKKKREEIGNFTEVLNLLRSPLDLPSAETCFGDLIILTNITFIALNKAHILLTNLKSKVCSLT